MADESRCPVAGRGRGHMNRDWWPNQLNVQVLHQHSAVSNPMGEAFDYAKAFKSLDLNAVNKDLHAVMTPALEVPVLLLRTRMHRLYCSFESDYGWGEFVRGGVAVKMVPGAHESILEEPHVATVARELRASLDRLEPRGSERSDA